MEGIGVSFLDPSQFLQFLKGQPILWQNYLPLALIAMAFRNGMRYRYFNVCINSANDASISCKNIMNFGPVTPEKMGLIC